MPDYYPAALAAAEAAIHDELKSSREVEPDRLARAALEAAAPLLAEAWNLVGLQAEHEAWQRLGEKGRKLRDDFWREIDARDPQAAAPAPVPPEGEEP